MVTQESTLTGLLNLISELRAREKTQEEELRETKINIEAVQRALDLLRQKHGLPAAEASREEYHGLNLPQALLKFARTHGGVIKVTDAKREFLAAGVMGGQAKTAYQRITSALIRSGHFEHSGPGEYRLLTEPVSATQSAFLRAG